MDARSHGDKRFCVKLLSTIPTEKLLVAKSGENWDHEKIASWSSSEQLAGYAITRYILNTDWFWFCPL